MDKVGIVNFQNNPQNFIGKPVLRDGSIIQGRVLSKNSSGGYDVSIAGQKVSVKVQSPMTEGAFFSAKVVVQKGQLILKLVSSENKPGFLEKYVPGSDKNSLNENLVKFLVNLGLPGDSQGVKIFQFMQQLGAKFDVDSAKKALALTKKNDRKMGELETSYLLEEKSIKNNDETVNAVLGKMYQKDEKSGSDSNDSIISKKKLFSEKDAAEVSTDDIKDFFEQCKEESMTGKYGILTAFNSLKSKEKNGKHWIVLPFEWNKLDTDGNFKLLLDNEIGSVEKINIFLKNSKHKYSFVLYLKGEIVEKVSYGVFPEVTEDVQKKYTGFLSSLLSDSRFAKTEIKYAGFETVSGFCSGDEVISVVGGFA